MASARGGFGGFHGGGFHGGFGGAGLAAEAATVSSSGGFFPNESSPVSRMELVEPASICF